MPARKPSPLAAQQPAPVYLNDPGGFWGNIARENATAGLGALLPHGTAIQADVGVKGRLLDAQIAWQPCLVRWGGCEIQASISDAQFLLAVEEGGDTQQGRITILINKLRFQKGFPTYGETMEIKAAGEWHEFAIAEMVGQHDDNEAGLFLYLEKDQNDIGN